MAIPAGFEGSDSGQASQNQDRAEIMTTKFEWLSTWLEPLGKIKLGILIGSP
ncbi:hypothetical protein OCAR_6050 [Afipia carboxidovorans OM5]|nr:hypothetical protein OCAR_6050 [Afipia carboxidovorans OM5]